jgi:hypothetical protein
MSAKRVNIVSLLALLFLVLVLAVTPEVRQLLSRLAFWVEGVEEKLEASRREREAVTMPPAEEGREAVPPEPEAVELPPPPHVVKSPDGQYHPEPGYSWVNDEPNNLEVVWVPGVKHPEQPDVVASTEPDQWRPAAGYDWAEAKGVNDMRVVWAPGKRHPDHEHVLAGEKAEEWEPEPGYTWVNDDPNDLSVVPADGAGSATPPS